jgi:lipoate-protein ligase B
VTWHGPGQLVCYALFDLHFHKQDLHWWVRSLEEAVILTLKEFKIEAHRNLKHTGKLQRREALLCLVKS